MSALVTDIVPLLVGAPSGIKKLRELVLQLAVSGRIAESDVHLWSERLLGELGLWGSGGTPLKTHPEYYGGTIPWLLIGDLNDGLVAEAENSITEEGLANSSAKLVPAGTVLIAMYGSIGKLGITGIQCATNQAIAHCQPNPSVVRPGFLLLLLRSMREGLLSRGQGLAQQNISQRILKSIPVKIPGLKEQERIEKKVDELMALCDRLEARQGDAESAHAQLVQALLDSLIQAVDAEDFATSWQRLAENFHTLFTTGFSIDALKQSLLQLAVMGKLVPQIASEGSADELLVCLAKDLSSYAATHKINAPKPEPISVSEHRLTPPKGWAWTRLCSMFRVITDGDHQPPPKSANGIAFLTIGNVTKGRLDFSGCRFVPQEYFDQIALYRRPEMGDILYTVVGATYGRPITVDSSRIFCVQRHIAILKSSEFVSPAFARYLLSSPWIYEQATQSTTGTAQPTIPLKSLRNFLVMLPPLAEQHRIVAKVDQLVGLCDRLKDHLVQSQQVHECVANALVAQAIA